MYLQITEDGTAFAIIWFFIILFVGIAIQYIKYRRGTANLNTIGFLKIKPTYKEALAKNFSYYKKLNERDKAIFEKRVQYFINIKHFIPRNISHVTDEMKALVAGSAIQLTFGLPKVYFTHFDKIIIYPDEYYSLINRRNHKGEVNVRGGIIVLSWKYFVQGYINPEDSINLGLHEMAHALRLENWIFNEEYKFFDEAMLLKWDRLAETEMAQRRCGKNGFFRSYACENKHEFFAVAVENFFERPQQLNEYNSELYQTMSKLLNQDTLMMYN